MNECVKAYIIRQRLKKIREVWGSKEALALYADMEEEIEYLSKDELWMVLNTLKSIDTTEKKEMTKEILLMIANAQSSAVKRYYYVLQVFIEGIHTETCTDGYSDRCVCSNILSTALMHLADDPDIFFREIKRHMYSQTGLSISTVHLSLLSVESVNRKLAVSLFHQYNSQQTYKSIEIVGALFGTIYAGEAISLIEGMYRKDDPFFLLRCAAYTAVAAAEKETESITEIKNNLISKGILNILRRCYKYKVFSQLVYTLAAGLFYLLGHLEGFFPILSSEILSFQLSAPISVHISQGMQILLKISANSQKRLQIISLCLELFIRSKVHHRSLLSLVLSALTYAADASESIESTSMQRILSIISQNKIKIEDAAEILMHLSSRHNLEKECAKIALKKSIQSQEKKKEARVLLLLNPVHFTLLEYTDLSKEIILYAQKLSASEMHMHFLHCLSRFKKNTILTAIQTVADRAEKEIEMMPVLIEMIKLVSVPYLFDSFYLQGMKKHYAYVYNILQLLKLEKYAAEYIEESIWNMSIDHLFSRGCAFFFYGCVFFFDLALQHMNNALSWIEKRVCSRSPVQYLYAAQILEHLLVNEERIDSEDKKLQLRKISLDICMDAFMLWIYKSKTLSFSVPSVVALSFLCAKKKMYPECKAALQYIHRDTTVPEILISCRTALLLLNASDGVIHHRRVQHSGISYLLEVLHWHEYAPAALLAFSYSVLSVADLDLQTKRACTDTILSHVSNTLEGISTLLNALEISADALEEVLEKLETIDLPLSEESLILLGRLTWRVKSYIDIARQIDRIDSIYSKSTRIDKKIATVYFQLKILQCRIFKECAESVMLFVLDKIEADGISPFLRPLLEELLWDTQIDADAAIKEIKYRAERKRAAHLLFLIDTYAVYKSPGAAQQLEYYTAGKGITIPLTETISGFFWEKSFEVQADKYLLIKEQCKYIVENAHKPGFLRNTMLFFVQEPLSPIVNAFCDACEVLPGLLADIFPFALYEGIRTLPPSLRRRVVDALGEVVKNGNLSQKTTYTILCALEYLLQRYMRQPEADYIIKHLEYSRVYRCQDPWSPQQEVQRMFYSLQLGPLDNAISLICSLRVSLHVQDEMVHQVADTLFREISFDKSLSTNNNQQIHSLHNRNSLQTVQCIREIGNSTESIMNPQITTEIQERLLNAESSLLHWSEPISSLIKSTISACTQEEVLACIKQIRKKCGSMLHRAVPEYGRMHCLFNKYQKKTISITELQQGLRNELCSSFLMHSGIVKTGLPCSPITVFDSPFASLLSLSLYNNDQSTVRGILCLESQEKIDLTSKVLDHYSYMCSSKKEFEDISNILLQTQSDRDIFSMQIDTLSQKRIRDWEKLSLNISAPIKKRVEILQKAMQVSTFKYDPLVFLSILCADNASIRERDIQEDINQIVEEIDATLWMDHLHEIFILSSKLFSYPPYLYLLEKLFYIYPDRISAAWAHYYVKEEKDRKAWTEVHRIFVQMEKNQYFVKQREADAMIDEIVETPNEKMLQLVKRFREVEKRAKETYRTESAWSLSMSYLDTSISPIQKNITQLDAALSILYKPAVFRKEYTGENRVCNYLLLFRKTFRARSETKTWKTLILNRISRLSTALEHALPSQIDLSARGIQVLSGTFLPGCSIKVHLPISTVSVLSSLQRPRKIAFIGENGVVYRYLIKRERESGIERPVAHIFSVLGINNSVAHEMLPNNVSISEYIDNSLSLKEVVYEIRESKEQLLERKGQLLLHKEKNALSMLCHDYNELREIEKLELYQRVTNFSGPEIKEWLSWHSPTLQSFFARVDTFSHTYLQSSIAAYILGLGDRHPGNILILFKNAASFHVDYADALDTLQHRKKLQEKVPLRLTPMITTTIGSGIEEQLLSAAAIVFSMFRRYSYVVESSLVIFFSNRKNYKRLSLADALSLVEKKVPSKEQEEEKGRRLFRDATSEEALSQMYIGWMPFW